MLWVACATAPKQPAAPARLEMRSDYLVLLRRGPAWTADRTPDVANIGAGHMAHIHEMGQSGKLVLAGPFHADASDRSALAGLFLFDVATVDEARALVEGDPAVRAGRFRYEILTWYGPKGITFPGAKAR